MRDSNGKILNAKVLAVEGGKVIVDCNHPLAGKTLVFELEVVEIR